MDLLSYFTPYNMDLLPFIIPFNAIIIANLLYDKFGQKRVNDELEEFLDHDFFPRFGGGIGVTRMIDGMKKANLI